jgi:hypothetical protein
LDLECNTCTAHNPFSPLFPLHDISVYGRCIGRGTEGAPPRTELPLETPPPPLGRKGKRKIIAKEIEKESKVRKGTKKM